MIDVKKHIKLIVFVCLFGLLPAISSARVLPPQQDIDSILNLAQSKYIYDQPDKAIEIGKDIYEKTSNTATKVSALILISTAYSSKRDYKNALNYVIEAKDLIQNSDNTYLKIVTYTKIGELYHQLKVYGKAIRFLDKAEELCLSYTKRPSNINFQLASNYIIKGFIYKDRLSCDIAISFFKKGIHLYEQLNYSGANISIAEYNIGNCYVILFEYEKAINSYHAAFNLAHSIQANSLQAFAQKGLAQVLTLKGDYSKAIDLLKKALDISKNVGDLVLNREIYRGLSENYLAINNREAYRKYNAQYLYLQAKVKTAERKSINNAINEIVQNKKHDLCQAKQNFNSFVWGISLGAFLLIFATFILTKRLNSISSSLQNKINLHQNKSKS